MVEISKDDGLDLVNDLKNTLPSHLGASILSNNKQIMKNLIQEINRFLTKASIIKIPTISFFGRNH